MPPVKTIIMNFDSHISKVTFTSDRLIVWTESGQSHNATFSEGSKGLGFEVTLEDGYIIDTVTADKVVINSVTDTSFNTSDNFTTTATINITSKQVGGDKMTYDLSTSSKWASLADGEHTVTIVAKADGYRDSEPSSAVTVTKGSSYTNVTLEKVNVGGQTQAGSYTSTGYTKISNADTSKYYLLRYALNYSAENFKTAYLYWDTTNSKWAVSNVQAFAETIQVVASESSSTEIVFYGATNTYDGAFGGWYDCKCVMTDTQPASATIADTVFANATNQSSAYYYCIIEGTQITLADRTTKGIEDITYDDELLCWDFYEGKFTSAKPAWITSAHTARQYNLVKFSNGAEVGFVGEGGNVGYHRIYNDEAKCFTHTGVAETPIGTTTFADDMSYPKIVSQEVVNKEVKFYNVGTEKHFNIFANGILTSSRISNIYAIEDMKYVGEQLISDEEVTTYIENKRNY